MAITAEGLVSTYMNEIIWNLITKLCDKVDKRYRVKTVTYQKWYTILQIILMSSEKKTTNNQQLLRVSVIASPLNSLNICISSIWFDFFSFCKHCIFWINHKLSKNIFHEICQLLLWHIYNLHSSYALFSMSQEPLRGL